MSQPTDAHSQAMQAAAQAVKSQLLAREQCGSRAVSALAGLLLGQLRAGVEGKGPKIILPLPLTGYQHGPVLDLPGLYFPTALPLEGADPGPSSGGTGVVLYACLAYNLRKGAVGVLKLQASTFAASTTNPMPPTPVQQTLPWALDLTTLLYLNLKAAGPVGYEGWLKTEGLDGKRPTAEALAWYAAGVTHTLRNLAGRARHEIHLVGSRLRRECRA